MKCIIWNIDRLHIVETIITTDIIIILERGTERTYGLQKKFPTL